MNYITNPTFSWSKKIWFFFLLLCQGLIKKSGMGPSGFKGLICGLYFTWTVTALTTLKTKKTETSIQLRHSRQTSTDKNSTSRGLAVEQFSSLKIIENLPALKLLNIFLICVTIKHIYLKFRLRKIYLPKRKFDFLKISLIGALIEFEIQVYQSSKEFNYTYTTLHPIQKPMLSYKLAHLIDEYEKSSLWNVRFSTG